MSWRRRGDLFLDIRPSWPILFCFQAEDGIRDRNETGVQTCALPISRSVASGAPHRDVAMAEPYARHRLNFNVLYCRSLVFCEIPNLRLRESDIRDRSR